MSFIRSLFSDAWDIAPTIWGWTPGLRELVGGRVLACGCLVGDYITRCGLNVTIIDQPAPACRQERHRLNHVVDRLDHSASHHGRDLMARQQNSCPVARGA
jgi:hypothetical protein